MPATIHRGPHAKLDLRTGRGFGARGRYSGAQYDPSHHGPRPGQRFSPPVYFRQSTATDLGALAERASVPNLMLTHLIPRCTRRDRARISFRTERWTHPITTPRPETGLYRKRRGGDRSGDDQNSREVEAAADPAVHEPYRPWAAIKSQRRKDVDDGCAIEGHRVVDPVDDCADTGADLGRNVTNMSRNCRANETLG